MSVDVRKTANKLAGEAGIAIRDMHNAEDARRWVRFADTIWQGNSHIDTPMVVALAHAGNYVTGAFIEDELVGILLGFWHEPASKSLHSHIAAVRADLT
ncbi:MAG: hypothetical protein LBU38_02625, partial [Propionibacteriaceae bacterium]|nr:hypothetical protein [Propionibacteriaceae bacterium]